MTCQNGIQQNVTHENDENDTDQNHTFNKTTLTGMTLIRTTLSGPKNGGLLTVLSGVILPNVVLLNGLALK